MKKLLYLLFAITLLGCGSNDDDNSSAQTFLEKYDDVVFECQNCPSNSDYSSPLYIGFTQSDNFLYYSWGSNSKCYYQFEGNLNGLDDDFGIVEITNHTLENLSYTKTYSDGVQYYNYKTRGTSLSLDIIWADGETASFNYLSTNFSVNDICN